MHAIGNQARHAIVPDPYRPAFLVCAHAGLKTVVDGPTHADPQPLQILQDNFPLGTMITLTPWDPQELFPLVTLAALPLAWDCARNGQATLIMTGLMLFAIVDHASGRWWRSALWLSLSVAVKPIAIVLPLMVMALDRPMTWRIPMALAALVLLPFAAQHPAYVLEQYNGFLQNTVTAAHVGAVDKGWTTPFNALQLVGVLVSARIQTGIRLAAAAGTLALYAFARRRREVSSASVYLFALVAIFLMLFSPRTENNTYAMIGPAIGVFCAWAVLVERRAALGILLGGVTLLTVGSRQLQRLLTPQADTSWIPPLMALCFAGYVIIRLFSVRKAKLVVDRRKARSSFDRRCL